MKPSAQTKLYGYEHLFNLLVKLDNNLNLPNKFIISGAKGIGKSTFAYHFINYIFSKKEEFKYNIENFEINKKNKSYTLIKKSTHPNFFLIDINDNKKKIDVDQIRKALEFSNKSSFNNHSRIILIDNIEYLTINSANALLKIIEEPNEKLIFILIHDSSSRILSTLKSRCIVFNKSLKTEENIKIFEKLTNDNFIKALNKDILSRYMSVGDLFNLKTFSEEHNIDLTDINHKKLLSILLDLNNKKSKVSMDLIIRYIQIYFYRLSLTKFTYKSLDQQSYFYKKFHDAKKYNLNFENIFLEFKTKFLNE